MHWIASFSSIVFLLYEDISCHQVFMLFGKKVEFTEVIQMSQIFKIQNGEWHIQDKFIPLNFKRKAESTIK